MRHCIRCGQESYGRICDECRKRWYDQRMANMDIIIAELGPMTNENHPSMVKRLKQLEREQKRAVKP